jgi:hypothetical protein
VNRSKEAAGLLFASALLLACGDSAAPAADAGSPDRALADQRAPDSGRAGDAKTGDTGLTSLQGVFVNSQSGKDLPDHGDPSKPFKTIGYAIGRAQPPVDVHVAAGTYPEAVTLRDGVSLLGGYSASDWRDRDPRAWDDPVHRTAIITAAGIPVSGQAIGAATVIEGFYLEGGTSTQDHHSFGIYLFKGASPLIRSNKIHGGHGDTYSIGIITVSSSAPTITGNLIGGGDAPTTYALKLSETTALVANNRLSGRGGTVESYGVLVNNGSPVVVNNTIDAGDASTAYGVFLFSAATPKVINNIIVVAGKDKSYGLYEATISGDAAVLDNNDLFGCATALYHNWGGSPADIKDLTTLHALSDTSASGNVVVDPGFVSASDWHLQPSSPATVRTGGIDESSLGISTDMDGKPRTVPWSMGAYEQD